MSALNSLIELVRRRKDADAEIEGMKRLRDAFEQDTNAFLNLTSRLRRSDLRLIGEVIQIYNYADFNARRIVTMLQSASTGDPLKPSTLSDADVLLHMERLTSRLLPDGNLKNGILKAHGTLVMHRAHRHDFAHWATRRIKGADALVMFTMNASQAEKRSETPLEAGASRFGILPLASFRGEVRKLEGHANFLAAAAAHIDTHISELREHISNRIYEERKKGSS